ncbi:hypothetical protein N9440_04345 [Alphaproteobacteria bacterium]|nr:hypothetical protein [Alphaproteobacteria bacterium]
MIKIYSRSEKDKLLHILYKKEDFADRQDIVEPSEFIQVASIVLSNNQTFKPHKHIWKNSKISRVIAQESWVIIKGKIKVDYYDLDNELLQTAILTEGDCTITLLGGHNYTSLTDDSLVYEFKTGPYEGQSNDKEPI